jgi:FkbM family methyltransferase
MNYDEKFIFDILFDQIRTCIDNWGKPLPHYTYEVAANHYWDSITDNGVMHIKDVKLPDIRWYMDWNIWPGIYADSLLVYHLFNNDYTEELVNFLECAGCEGPYGYKNVKAEKGDIVIDGGGYIGDNAAQFAAIGAKVYSFEPSPRLWPILKHAALLNDFIPIQMGLGDVTTSAYINNDSYSCGDFINVKGDEACEVITIDDFAEKENVKIDFIKADIEGFERHMLRGARKTLECDAPKLALKTYHIPGDPEEMRKLILEANPKYIVIQKSRTMYCYVP